MSASASASPPLSQGRAGSRGTSASSPSPQVRPASDEELLVEDKAAFLAAIRRKDIEAMIHLSRREPNVLSKSLHLDASVMDHIIDMDDDEFAIECIKLGVALEIHEGGKQLLHECIERGWTNAALYLIENCDIDLNATVPEGFYAETFTPAHFAARANNPAVLQALMKKGADVRRKDKNGFMPLHWAIIDSNVGSMELLCNVQDIFEPNITKGSKFRGFYPIHLAAIHDTLEQFLASVPHAEDTMHLKTTHKEFFGYTALELMEIKYKVMLEQEGETDRVKEHKAQMERIHSSLAE